MKTLKELFTGTKPDKEMLKSSSNLDNNRNVQGHGHGHHTPLQTLYQCPMKCEGEKTYDVPGNCPHCNMKLVPVESKNSHGQHHHCC